MEKDYLVVIGIMGGSSYGRDPDKEKALKTALKEAKSFFKALGMVPKKGAELDYSWIDLTDTGIQKVEWTALGTYFDDRKMTDTDPQWQYDTVTI